MNDHQEWQDNAQEHQDQAEAEKETGRIHHKVLNRKHAKIAKKTFLKLFAPLACFTVNLLI